MDEKIIIGLNDLYINAGIVGLLHMLPDDIVKKEENHITIDKAKFLELDLTQLYFDTLIEIYGEDTSYYRTTQIIDKLLNDNTDTLKDDISYIKKTLSANSITTGYNIIKDKIDTDYSFIDEVKELNYKLDLDTLKKKLEQLKQFLLISKVKETFQIKNIAYTVINDFWNNKSFLSRNNSKKDMYDIHNKEVIEPLKEYLKTETKEKDLTCLQCQRKVKPNQTCSIAFVNDMGDDMGRKRSMYWNFDPNNYYICPLCAFLYTLLPLGFVKENNSYIFVNCNTGVNDIQYINKQKNQTLTGEDKSYYGRFIKELDELATKQQMRVNNIQVLVKDSGKSSYHFNILDELTLNLIRECLPQLKYLLTLRPIRLFPGQEPTNIFNIVLQNIIMKKSQRSLLSRLVKLGIQNQTIMKYYAYNVLLIEIKRNTLKTERNDYYG